MPDAQCKNPSFLKMHDAAALSLLDNRADGFIPDEPLRRAIADRHRGVGCDQLIILGPPSAKARTFSCIFIILMDQGSRCLR